MGLTIDYTAEFFTAAPLADTLVSLSGPTIDLRLGSVFVHSPVSNATYVFNNAPPTGLAYGFTLRVATTGTIVLTWPSSVAWKDGATPDGPDSGATNIYTFYTDDGGATYYGFLAGVAMS